MAYDMYSQLEINNEGQWALTIFIATIFNGFNTSWYLDYWPSYIFKLRRYATNAEGPDTLSMVGAGLTFVVLLAYFGIAHFFMFIMVSTSRLASYDRQTASFLFFDS